MYGLEGYLIDAEQSPDVTVIAPLYEGAPHLHISDGKGTFMDLTATEILLGTPVQKTQLTQSIAALRQNINDFLRAGLTPSIQTPIAFGDSETEQHIIEQLKEDARFIERGAKSAVWGFAPEWYLQAAATNTSAENASGFVRSYLSLLQLQAARTTVNRTANIQLDPKRLVRDIGKLAKLNLPVPDIAPITYFANNDILAKNRPDYVRAIVEDNATSFTYNAALETLAQALTASTTAPLEKSRAIFTWIRANIAYDHDALDSLRFEYRGALQTFKDGRGVCGETAALQVTMERLVGNRAVIAAVGDDHAVTAHIEPNNAIILIDTTTDRGFDAPYRDYKLLSDMQSLARYRV